MKKPLFSILLLLLLLPACKSDNGTKVAKQNEPIAATAEPTKDAEESDAPPTNLYPTFAFGKLNKDERKTFVKVAKAELCPCKGSVVSLDECLKSKETACDLAVAAANTALNAIHSGKNETDALADISEAIENLKKVYQFQLEGRPYLGAADAKVVVVEFADFQCPYCKKASETMHKLEEHFKGKSVAFYFKHFPLQHHTFGQEAAAAAVAAMNQGKFWPMHDLLFDSQNSLSKESFPQFAKKIGLNIKKFDQDRTSTKTQDFISKDKEDGENADLTGTPTIYINGQKFLASPVDYDAFVTKIDALLKESATP